MYVDLFGRPKYDILADLISQQNNLTVPLNASYLSFGNITGSTVPGNEDRVSVLVTGRSPITGSRSFTYSRIDLNKLLSSTSPSLVLPETAITVADLLPLIRVKYNIYIDAEDVSNAAEYLPFISSGSSAVITIQTKATTTYNSHVWSGNLDITCTGGSSIPRGSILTESGAALLTEDSNFLVVESSSS